MPLKGDNEALKILRKLMKDLGKAKGVQEKIAKNVITEVRAILKEQFATGEGPYGKWKDTKRGKQALKSNKLPQDFIGVPIPGGVRFISRIKWLSVHQTGYTFPARAVAANSNYLTFNKRGKLIARSKIFTVSRRSRHAPNRPAKQIVRGGVYQIFARAHKIGARVLPRRPIYPDRGVPPKWAARINAGAVAAMAKWQPPGRVS